jgi:nucleotide-binding universal stress UspA family protein
VNPLIRSILHPTDFSDLSSAAFAHALRMAVAAKCKLYLLHVVQGDAAAASGFPNVQRLLAQWGLCEPQDAPSEILKKLGLAVENISLVSLKQQNPALGIVGFLDQHPCDLVVTATRGRNGFDHWLKGSISESVFRRTAIPTLFVTHGARSFVSQVSGDVRLRRVLVPVDFSPPPGPAIEAILGFGRLMAGADVTVHLVHVGSAAPPVDVALPRSVLPPVMLRTGDVVKSITDAAVEYDVDFVGMPTAGHHGFLDALRGSTTERLIRSAPCPVLAMPVE